MANEITITAPNYSGLTLQAYVTNALGQIYNGATFETPVDANILTYPIAMAEAGTLGIFRGTFPVVAAGVYGIAIRQRVSATAAVTDPEVGSGIMKWNGTAEIVPTSQTDWTPTKAGYLDAAVSTRTKPADTQAAVTNLTNAPTNGDFTTTMKTSLNAASVTVSDKTGFSLSAAGILAIWNQLTSDVGIITSSFAKLLKDYLNAAVGGIPTNPMLATAKPTVGGYDTGQDPATLLLVTPANKINTDSANAVKIQKMAVTVAAGDVSGNLPADVKTYTVQPTVTGATLAADQAVNATKISGVLQTGRDLGASVLLSPGTGTGQVSLASGTVTVGTNNDKSGYSIASGQIVFKKNQAFPNFQFIMTDSENHVPIAALSVTASRRIDSGSWTACANPVIDVTNGFYSIDLAASDINGSSIALRFAATGADDLGVLIVTQP